MSTARPTARKKARTLFRCQECGVSSPRWVGRCAGCEQWNTLVEEVDAAQDPGGLTTGGDPTRTTDVPVPIADVDVANWSCVPTSVSELDRVLGGGLVPGSVTLVGGEPGIGKSTLLLQALGGLATRGTVLYVTAEESKEQVRVRAERLGTLRPRLLLVSETDLGAVLAHIEASDPIAVVIDSIQTVFHPELGSAPGTVAQVRECASLLVQVAKRRKLAMILVGHVTKDGSLAGPRVLEHLVDTVLTFEGDRHHAVRVLRAVKHRYAGTGELGLLQMTGAGLLAVDDPSGLFLADRRAGVSGSVVSPLVDGQRAVLQEIQGLVVESDLKFGRRAAEGVDGNRLALLLAVLNRHCGIVTTASEVYASVVGGVPIDDPGADLAVALAVASAARRTMMRPETVVFGEVGLGGEVRQVQHAEKRLAEAARMGFLYAVVPTLTPDPPPGITLVRVGSVEETIRRVLIEMPATADSF